MITKQPSKFIKNPIFVSYTSLSDFLKCPNSYYLKNIYRNPQTGHRMQIASPYLSLGSVVHDTIKWYLEMTGQVTHDQVIAKYRNFWLKYRRKRGGFSDDSEEVAFGKRGILMLENFFQNANKLDKFVPPLSFPKYHLIEDAVLVGNLDFVGEREDGSLHIIDFKTGTKDEEDPLQLHIYAILAEANIGKPVTRASFWYLDREDEPREIVLDSLEPKVDWLKEKARELKQAIGQDDWVCIKGDELCKECQLYQALKMGKGEFQFSDYKFKKDVYFLPRTS